MVNLGSMRVFLFVLFFAQSVNIAFAQISDVVFIGSLVLKDGGVYSYKLQVTDSNGVISGYSITDLMGPNETKTLVKGTINASKKQISFHETKMVSSKSTINKEDFCFVHARLKVVTIKGVTSLKGTFEGYRDDGKTICADGKVMLMCAQEVLDKLMEIAKEDSAEMPKTDTVKKEPKTVKITYENDPPESQVLKVLPGKTIDLYCPATDVTLEIWDSKTIDGDIITLMDGNKALLENYTISGRRKSVNVKLDGNENKTLRLIAISEGSEPLCTARIKVISGNDIYFVDATTTIGKDVWILLKRKK